MGLYELQRTDVARASSVLFEAFLEDPFFQYMLGESRLDEGIVRSLHAFTINLGIRYGEVHAPTEALEGIAIWLPPRHARITAWKSLMSGLPGVSLARSLGWKRTAALARRMSAYSRYADGLHEQCMPNPHWYLLSIGVGDQYRGRGYASRLLRPMLDRCDKESLPCYLETHNERNVGLYSHYGFFVKVEGQLPGSDGKHWAMVRNPGNQGTSKHTL
jgi:ribosomal protein S18 acetylase RimI-like enzyme